MNIPTIKTAKQDLEYFKFQNHILCKTCKGHNAHFCHLTFTGNLINWIFNCSRDGEDFLYSCSYEKLLSLYFKKDLTGDFKTLLKCFNLGLYFDQVFKSETEKQKFGKIICKLNKATSGIRGFWNRRKYATN